MALALVALVAVPIYYGQRVAVVQARITDVLEPAARHASNLRLLKARQMARMEGYLTTQDIRRFRDPYRDATDEEDSVLAELFALAPMLDEVPPTVAGVTFVERMSELQEASLVWRVQNQVIFDSRTIREDARDLVVAGYDDLQTSTTQLERAIVAEVAAGRRRVALVQQRQSAMAFGLAGLALFATLIVARVGYRYRALTVVSEQRRLDAVRARREIDALLEATGDGVLGIDLEGRCISLNRAGEQLLGFLEGEIRGRDVHDTLFHTTPEGSPFSRDASELLRAAAEGRTLQSSDGAVIWRRKRNSFPARWTLQPMIDGTQLVGAVLTFTDMTEIREKESALHRAVRQREDVVSIVSHDLRNPLGVALASADLLLDLPLDEAQRRRQAEIIRRSGKRMQRLIDDLLDVARMDAGMLVVRPSREELHPILVEAATIFREQARDRSIRLDVAAPAGAPAARVDRDRIIQGLSNLLDNAIRLTPEGGAVTLSVEEDEDDVLVSVGDTGPGIPPELVDNLFDRFAQGDEIDRGAAGLGLSIVKGVAKAHGGDVSVVSVPGEGSLFTIRLPREGPAPAETTERPVPTA